MHERSGRHLSIGRGGDLSKRLDKMLAAGRLTAEEAEQLRTAITDDERAVVAAGIQRRHARARIDEALANGGVTKPEADALVERLEGGEDPTFLRGLRRTH